MKTKILKVSASVKVMRSFDYNHFECVLSSDEKLDDKQINSLRVRAARLVDHAIESYKLKKEHENKLANEIWNRRDLENKVKAIIENFPKSQWTPEQKAQVKKLDDLRFADQFVYNEEY